MRSSRCAGVSSSLPVARRRRTVAVSVMWAAVEEDVGAGGENLVGGDGLATAQHDLAVGEAARHGVGGVLGVAVALARDDFREELEGGERRVGLGHADAGSAEAVARGQRRCELALFAGHSM